MGEEIETEMGGVTLRGIKWRMHLGVLPPLSTSIHHLRHAAAHGRRRYADLRRRFLVDPHIMEDGQKTVLCMDNPLSQDPDSVWGRFFQNAELERNIDKDLSRLKKKGQTQCTRLPPLSRLYPENESYFQKPACQATLRRILLVWSLAHPEYSYQQGMHELLAALLYVLHVDVMHLSSMKHLFEDLSDERFDGLLLGDKNLSGNFERQLNLSPARGRTSISLEEDRRLTDFSMDDLLKSQEKMAGIACIDELDPFVRAIILGSDAYGAEGELGALLSGRFLEHDAYCLFDSLLCGKDGRFAIADFYINRPGVGSASGLSPVLEASASLYKLLAVTDVSLYNYLVELQVEPQFFALRWFRVLFGREFELHELMLIWDAIFSATNDHIFLNEDSLNTNNCNSCAQSTFILSLAVSMLLELRSTLLASPNATTCLKRLLCFPSNTNLKKLIETAKSLQPVALKVASNDLFFQDSHLNQGNQRTVRHARSKSLSSSHMPSSHTASKMQRQMPNASPETLKVPITNYWEEKWKYSVMQKANFQNAINQIAEDDVILTGKSCDNILNEGLCVTETKSASKVENNIQKKKSKNDAILCRSRSEVMSARAFSGKNDGTGQTVEFNNLNSEDQKRNTFIGQIKGKFHGIPFVSKTEEEGSNGHDSDKMNNVENQNQVRASNHSRSKASSEQAFATNSSQKASFLNFWRKQKQPSTTNAGRSPWIWNIGRTITGSKEKSEDILTTESGPSKVKETSEKNVIIPDREAKDEVLDYRMAAEGLESYGVESDKIQIPIAEISLEQQPDEILVTRVKDQNNGGNNLDNSFGRQTVDTYSQNEASKDNASYAVSSSQSEDGMLYPIKEFCTSNHFQTSSHGSCGDVENTDLNTPLAASEESECPKDSSESHRDNLRHISKSIFDKIQDLELSLLQEMIVNDSPTFDVLTQLRDLTSKLLQSCQ